MHTGYWWGNMKEKFHLEDLGVDGNITLKRVLNKRNWRESGMFI